MLLKRLALTVNYSQPTNDHMLFVKEYELLITLNLSDINGQPNNILHHIFNGKRFYNQLYVQKKMIAIFSIQKYKRTRIPN